MTDIVWLGDDSGNEGDMAVVDNYTPAQLPTDDDTLIVNELSQVAPSSNLETLTGVALAAFERHEGATIDFGDPDATKYPEFRIASGGYVRINSARNRVALAITSPSVSAQLDVIQAPPTPGLCAIMGRVTVSPTGIIRGHVSFTEDGTKTDGGSITSIIGTGPRVGSQATMVVDANTTLGSSGTVEAGGRLETAVTPSNWNIRGTCVTSGAAGFSGEVHSTGRVQHGGSGAVSALTGRNGGEFERTGAASYTFGGGTGTVKLGGSFVLDLGDAYAVSLGTGIQMLTPGGRFRLPAGTLVGLTPP